MNQSSVVPYMVLINGALMAHGVDQRTATGVHGRKAEHLINEAWAVDNESATFSEGMSLNGSLGNACWIVRYCCRLRGRLV